MFWKMFRKHGVGAKSINSGNGWNQENDLWVFCYACTVLINLSVRIFKFKKSISKLVWNIPTKRNFARRWDKET